MRKITIYSIKHNLFSYLVFNVIKRRTLFKIFMLHCFLLLPCPENNAGNSNAAKGRNTDYDYNYDIVYFIVFDVLVLLNGVHNAYFVICRIVNSVELLEKSNTNNPSCIKFIFQRVIVLFDSQYAINGSSIIHLNNGLPGNNNFCITFLSKTLKDD